MNFHMTLNDSDEWIAVPMVARAFYSNLEMEISYISILIHLFTTGSKKFCIYTARLGYSCVHTHKIHMFTSRSMDSCTYILIVFLTAGSVGFWGSLPAPCGLGIVHDELIVFNPNPKNYLTQTLFDIFGFRKIILTL